MITKPVSEELRLDAKFPILEIMEIKKKSFIAEKAKIYKEEKIPSISAVASVEISNISKTKKLNLKKNMITYLF